MRLKRSLEGDLRRLKNTRIPRISLSLNVVIYEEILRLDNVDSTRVRNFHLYRFAEYFELIIDPGPIRGL
jgi:hypothetical protein